MLCYLIIFFCVYSKSVLSFEMLNLTEGSRCNWKHLSGQCVNFYRCMSAVIDVDNRNPPPICTLNSDVPIICCTDCHLINDTRNLIYDRKIGIHFKTGVVSQDYCLSMLHELDYPCKRATYTSIQQTLTKDYCYTTKPLVKRTKKLYNPFAWKEELTHLAMLGYGQNLSTVQWLCGGSLISENYILTAAHCIENPSAGRVSFAGLGVRKHTDSRDLWQRYRIIARIPHPKYQSSSKYHDIALLRTDMPVLFNYHVAPICLPQPKDINDEPAMSASIGSTVKGKRDPMNPCYVYLNRFRPKECEYLYPASTVLTYGFNSTTQICYGYKNRRKPPCENDGGASLHKRNSYYPCGFSIIGITSFERTWTNSAGHGLYTNVIYYNSWIESVVWSTKLQTYFSQ